MACLKAKAIYCNAPAMSKLNSKKKRLKHSTIYYCTYLLNKTSNNTNMLKMTQIIQINKNIKSRGNINISNISLDLSSDESAKNANILKLDCSHNVITNLDFLHLDILQKEVKLNKFRNFDIKHF